jgi:protein gp37
MGKTTEISWCDATFNPWIGCTKVSPGCANCYAEVNTSVRTKGIKWGKDQPRQRTSAAYWRGPITWNKIAHTNIEAHPGYAHVRPRVFCASLADWLDDEVPVAWLRDLLLLIEATPNLDWLLLTKRPQNWQPRLQEVMSDGIPWKSDSMIQNWLDFKIPPKNVWVGTSVEDQIRADLRIPHLVKIPAVIRFLSVEPLLSFVGLSLTKDIHWAIFGGESGPNSRPCNIDWIRSGVTQCRAVGVRPFVKQLGAVCTVNNVPGGSRIQLKDRKGGDITEFPEDLRVREWPA